MVVVAVVENSNFNLWCLSHSHFSVKSQRFRRSKKNDLLAFLEEVVKHGITAGMLHIHSFISIPTIRDDFKIRFLIAFKNAVKSCDTYSKINEINSR